MEPIILHKGLEPGLQLPYTTSLAKKLGMFWDLPAQSQLR